MLRIDRWAALLLTVGSVACEPAPSGDLADRARDSAGVTLRSVAPRPIVSVDSPLVRLGLEDAPLGIVTGGLLLGDSVIALVDQYEEGVTLYSISGARIGQIARRGDGPGELRSISALFRYGSDGVVLGNMGVSRAETFGLDGARRRSVRRTWSPPSLRSGPRVRACCTLLGALPDGRLLLAGPDEVPLRVDSPIEASRPLYIWDPAQAEADPLTSPLSGHYRPPAAGSPTTHDRIHFNTSAMAAAAGSMIATADGRARSLDFIDDRGRLRVRTQVRGPRIAIDGDVTGAVLQKIDDDIARVGRDAAEASGLTWLATLEFPDSIPAYTRLIASPEQVWAGLEVDSYLGLPSRYDTFTSEGVYRGTLTLPPGAVVLDVSGGRVLLKRRGDAGQALVEVREVGW